MWIRSILTGRIKIIIGGKTKLVIPKDTVILVNVLENTAIYKQYMVTLKEDDYLLEC